MPLRAIALSCPHCYRHVVIGDVVVDKDAYEKSIRTCSRIIILRKARLTASTIEARMGIELQGTAEGNLRSGSLVTLGSRAILRGSLTAPRIIIEPGARIDDALIRLDPALAIADAAAEAHTLSAVDAAGSQALPPRSLIEPASQPVELIRNFTPALARQAAEKLRVTLSFRKGKLMGYRTR